MKFNFQSNFNTVFGSYVGLAMAKKAGTAAEESLALRKQSLEQGAEKTASEVKLNEAEAYKARAIGKAVNQRTAMQKKQLAEKAALDAVNNRMSESAASKMAVSNMQNNMSSYSDIVARLYGGEKK